MSAKHLNLIGGILLYVFLILIGLVVLGNNISGLLTKLSSTDLSNDHEIAYISGYFLSNAVFLLIFSGLPIFFGIRGIVKLYKNRKNEILPF